MTDLLPRQLGGYLAKTDRQRAMNAADKWFSLYIRLRDGNRSVLSGIPQGDKQMNCGHVIRREYLNTRWNEANAFCITAGENRYHEMNPHPFNEWVEAMFPGRLDELWRAANDRSDPHWPGSRISKIAQYWKERYELLSSQQE